SGWFLLFRLADFLVLLEDIGRHVAGAEAINHAVAENERRAEGTQVHRRPPQFLAGAGIDCQQGEGIEPAADEDAVASAAGGPSMCNCRSRPGNCQSCAPVLASAQ